MTCASSNWLCQCTANTVARAALPGQGQPYSNVAAVGSMATANCRIVTHKIARVAHVWSEGDPCAPHASLVLSDMCLSHITTACNTEAPAWGSKAAGSVWCKCGAGLLVIVIIMIIIIIITIFPVNIIVIICTIFMVSSK